jgi:hypothetical protein
MVGFTSHSWYAVGGKLAKWDQLEWVQLTRRFNSVPID